MVEECEETELNEKEKYWIEQYNSVLSGYNVDIGGNSGHSIKIGVIQVMEITDILKNSELSMQEIADKYGVSYEMIQGINTGRHWNRNIKYPIRKHSKMIYRCSECGEIITAKYDLCVACARKKRTIRPSKNTLVELIKTHTLDDIAKLYSVSTRAVIKWCSKYNLPHTNKSIMEYQNNAVCVI